MSPLYIKCVEMERHHSNRKIQIVKSFAIPKFMSKDSLIHVSNDLIKAVNSELYSFIWKGKDKVKRLDLINDIEYEGLKILDIESMILSQSVVLSQSFVSQSVVKIMLALGKFS